MEMLVKMMEVLLYIAVMMMAPSVFRRHRERGGESPPSSSSSLTFSLDGRRVYPLVLGSHGLGGARAPPILDLSLCFCVPRFYPFTVSFISRVHNTDWGESFDQIFLIKLAFLRQKKSFNRLTSG